MQDESRDLCSSAQRLDTLRNVKQASWAEIAKLVGMSESMLYQVKSGRRQPSSKALYRLAQAEREAGISPPLKEQLADSDPEKQGELIESASFVELAQLLGPKGQRLIARFQLETFEMLSKQFFFNLEGLCMLARRAAPESSDKEVREDLPYFIKKMEGEAPKIQEWIAMLIQQLSGLIHDPEDE